MPEITRDFTRADLPALRTEVERFGTAQGLDGLALYRFVAAVHELATNAIRHGGGAGHLYLGHSGTALRCRVTDRGPGFPDPGHELTPPDSRALNGRGLWYVRNVAATLDISSDPTGTSVTVTMPG
ncbi:ATP-binding protein [Actinoplanes oblitus]|uniref:ATP-binding protein n=1 Tax=Actinoplanes oblitus TaxID=3040509 RepID=A0ABY8WUD6_9ACTN|nr:ATP-binding protein [Actinoplanes oblitus]WIN00667.1 ATP-binding protein [Actinoplanes oblitus]